MRIRTTAILAALFLIGLPCFAQSNSSVDTLLSQDQAQGDYVAYMVLAAGGQVGEDSTPEEAFALAQEKGWIPARRLAADPIHLDQYCYLVMKSLDLKGGLMYMIFPGPRYAFKEFVAKGIVAPDSPRRKTLAGDEVLRYLRLAMDLKGGEK